MTRLAGCNGSEDCHVNGNGGLYFPPGNELLNVVFVRSSERGDLYRVKPGDPWASYLYLKAQGDGGIEGGRMPLGGPYDAQLAPLLLSWIEAGAPKP